MTHLITKKPPAVNGTVFLVGAGPGDPGLLTRAGADALARADVVIYDRLLSPVLLELAREDAERIYVGKGAAQHTCSQQEINELLAYHAGQGKMVCRLKGGDPFVFGRGGEEAAYLRARNIPFVIVPGVSSAIAVPAYAGIPLTDRRYASSFAVITGHEDAAKSATTLNWSHIAQAADTLVFLMGLANLPTIAEQLISHGRVATTPVATIAQGTTPQQRTVVGTLADIAARVSTAGLQSPVITVVGEVVALREEIAWFEQRPLFGKRVLVTRAREQAADFSILLQRAGAEAVEFPLIKMLPIAAQEDLLLRLQHADWLVFTSANCIAHLLRQVSELGGDIRALGKAKIAAIGPATAESMHKYGLHVDFLPVRFCAEAIAAGLPDPSGLRVVIPRVTEPSWFGEPKLEASATTLPKMLSERGALVDVVPLYRTVAAGEIAPDLSRIDVITFTSSSTVEHFCDQFPDKSVVPVIACIGPLTATTAREMGLVVDIVAEENTIPAFVDALEQFYLTREKKVVT